MSLGAGVVPASGVIGESCLGHPSAPFKTRPGGATKGEWAPSTCSSTRPAPRPAGEVVAGPPMHKSLHLLIEDDKRKGHRRAPRGRAHALARTYDEPEGPVRPMAGEGRATAPWYLPGAGRPNALGPTDDVPVLTTS